jgi:hypothetical protein
MDEDGYATSTEVVTASPSVPSESPSEELHATEILGKHGRDEFPENEERSNDPKRPRRHLPYTSLERMVPPYYHLVVHRVSCKRAIVEGEDHGDHAPSASYLDVPRLFANDTRGSTLRGLQRLSDMEEFLERNPGVCLVVYKHYSCTAYHREAKASFETMAAGIDRRVFNRLRPWLFSLKQDGRFARAKSENIVVTSETLKTALDAVVASDSQRLVDWNVGSNLSTPYDYFYHFRHKLRQQSAAVLSRHEQELVHLLLNYIDESYGPAFHQVDTLFATGYVHKDYFTKLIGPNELIVTQQEGFHRAYIAERFLGFKDYALRLDCWSWEFDGSFRKSHVEISIPWPDPDASTVPISSLTAWPLRLDSSNLRQRLERRGREFWSCRHRRFVSYIAPSETVFELQTV